MMSLAQESEPRRGLPWINAAHTHPLSVLEEVGVVDKCMCITRVRYMYGEDSTSGSSDPTQLW